MGANIAYMVSPQRDSKDVFFSRNAKNTLIEKLPNFSGRGCCGLNLKIFLWTTVGGYETGVVGYECVSLKI